MVVRVALIASLIATDLMATATIAINPVIWHEIAPVPVVRMTLVATLIVTDPVVTATTVSSPAISHAIALMPVLCPALATATAAVSPVTWRTIVLVPAMSPAVATGSEQMYDLCLRLLRNSVVTMAILSLVKAKRIFSFGFVSMVSDVVTKWILSLIPMRIA